jgi:hypothetical protein
VATAAVVVHQPLKPTRHLRWPKSGISQHNGATSPVFV